MGEIMINHGTQEHYEIDNDKVIQRWYKNGELHREDGPAVIIGSIQKWYLDGRLHRVDGPAVIDNDHQEWWVNGEFIER